MKPLRANLATYKDDEFPDDYVDPSGCCWNTASEMLVNSDDFLGLCGCGLDGDFDYILAGLELIERRGPDGVRCDGPEWKAYFDKREADEKALFGSDHSAQFFYKWADHEGLSEHGGSVPGWLSDTGKALIALMREAKALDATATPPPSDASK